MHINIYTEDEVHRQIHENKMVYTLVEIDAFISILYVHSTYFAKGLGLYSLWLLDWGLMFLQNTMPVVK